MELTRFRGHFILLGEEKGVHFSPFAILLRPPIEGSEERDFHLPANRFVAEVTNRATGLPIAAEAVIHRDLGDPRGVWAGRGGDDGVIEIPEDQAGRWLLIRHPASGFLVRRWQPGEEGEDPLTWILPPAAPPLAVRAVDNTGESVAWADFALWLGDMRLAGPCLAWLTETGAASDGSGTWRPRHLPAEPIKVLAWSLPERSDAALGAFDASATVVPFPWPDRVTVEAY